MSSTPNTSFSTSPKGRICVSGLLEFTLVEEEEGKENTSWSNWSVDTIPVRNNSTNNNNVPSVEQVNVEEGVEEERFEEIVDEIEETDVEEGKISMKDLILSKAENIEVITIEDDKDDEIEVLEQEPEKNKVGERFEVNPVEEVEVKQEILPGLDPTNPRPVIVRQDTVELEETVTPTCADKLKLMLRAFKRDRSTPKETPSRSVQTALSTLRERDQWQHRLRYLLARQAEVTAYKEVYNWVIDNEVDMKQLLALFNGAEDWTDGKFEIAEVFSNVQLKKNDRASYALRVEAAEEAKVQQLIRTEIGANLSTAVGW